MLNHYAMQTKGEKMAEYIFFCSGLAFVMAISISRSFPHVVPPYYFFIVKALGGFAAKC
jgi:hypothetical protein